MDLRGLNREYGGRIVREGRVDLDVDHGSEEITLNGSMLFTWPEVMDNLYKSKQLLSRRVSRVVGEPEGQPL